MSSIPKSHASETRSVTFEWPLHNLKHHFDSSTTDTKSKVVKSVPFDGGRWTVLFYAQSGIQQYCSLYLNAEPLPDEKIPQFFPATPKRSSYEVLPSQSKVVKYETTPSDERWSREGLYRFTFKIVTLDKAHVLGTKEAHDHAFSHKTSNWGWAQFVLRDIVYYNNLAVRSQNAFLISVTITAAPEKPRVEPSGISVPLPLVQAMGSLLDDPDHSDIVFILGRRKRDSVGVPAITRERKIYAIKKILASRCEYFKDMFEGGFLEADAVESSDDEPGSKLSALGLGQDQECVDEGAFSSDEELVLDDSDEDWLESDHEGEHEAEDFDLEIRPDPISVDGPMQPQSSRVDDLIESEDSYEDRGQSVSVQDSKEISDDAQQRAFKDLSSATVSTPPVGMAEAAKSTQRKPASSAAETDDTSKFARARAQSNNSFQTPSHSPHTSIGGGTLFKTLSPSAAAPNPSTPVDRTVATSRRMPRAVDNVPGRIKPDFKASERAGNGKKRRKVIVRDAAYSTFKALLYYLYTDTVVFAPLTSSFIPAEPNPSEEVTAGKGPSFNDEDETRWSAASSSSDSFIDERKKAHAERQAVIDAYCQKHPDRPSPCSAKSMYRLADKLQIPTLKRRAKEELSNNLSVQNIVWEVFSGFNTRFPDIRKMETAFLLSHWPEVKRTKAMRTIFSRPMAHPGLADVWPYLLSQLEYNGTAAEPAESAGDDQ